MRQNNQTSPELLELLARQAKAEAAALRLWAWLASLRARARVAIAVLLHKPGAVLDAKETIAYGVDIGRRVLLLHARGPLDLSVTTVELSYSQLKHVAGQLMAQEGQLEQERERRGRIVKI